MYRYLTFALAFAAFLVLTPSAAPLRAQSAPGIEGTWAFSLVAEGFGTTELKLVISRDGDHFKVESSGSPDLTVSGATVDGSTVTLKAAYQGGGFDLPGTLSEGSMGGNWNNGFAGGTWSAKKSS